VILALWVSLSWAAEADWTVAEVPEWVAPQAVPQGSRPGQEAGGGVQLLLDDEQVDVGRGVETHYYREVMRITSVAGIQDHSELSFSFDPSYESMVLHHITLRRGGEVIDALRPDEIRVIQRERDMDLRIYNGELEVLAFLNDVRVGDVIDSAWSVSGTNPALAGHYVDSLWLDRSLPVARIHRRLQWRGERPLVVKAHHDAPEAQVKDGDGQVVYTWMLEDVPAAAWDGAAPEWMEQLRWVQLSDFQSWSEVVDWALPLYETRDLGVPLREAIDGWRAAGDDEARLRAALEFVQDDVRYLGIEMGPRGLVPHPVSETFGRRFGDCKDKSLLLVAALGEMGIEAHPALVHTRRRRGIRDLHPTVYAFNHAIVRVKVDGQTLWLDPTRSHERGPPAQMSPVGFEAALVLEPGGAALTEIETPSEVAPQVEILERFGLAEIYGPVILDVYTRTRGRHASALRRRLERELPEEIRSARLRRTVERYPGAEPVTALEVRDDPDTGVLTLVERYRLPGLWRDGAFALVGLEALRVLDEPPAGARVLPLALHHPTHRRHVAEVVLPASYVLREGSDRVGTDAFEFEVDRAYDGQVLRLETTYRSLADAVPPDAVDAHRDAVEAARALGVHWIFVDELDRGMDRTTLGALVGLGAVLFLFVLGPTRSALSGWWRRRRMVSQLRTRTPSTPEAALQVDDTVQANRALKAMRCACGAPLDQGVPKSSDMRHEGVYLLVLETGCSACALRTTAYFRFRG